MHFSRLARTGPGLVRAVVPASEPGAAHLSRRLLGCQHPQAQLPGCSGRWPATFSVSPRFLNGIGDTAVSPFSQLRLSRAFGTTAFRRSVPQGYPEHKGRVADRLAAQDENGPQKWSGTKSAVWVIVAFAATLAVSAWARGTSDLHAEARQTPAKKGGSGGSGGGAQEQSSTASGRKHFRMDEIRQHGSDSPNPWVIFGTGVYDITDWIESHPGGKVILRAAGSAVEPYWDIFTIHKTDDVYQILEQYRIGDVDPRDLVDGGVPHHHIEDPFREDPSRDPRLLVRSERPCNAESPASALLTFLTETCLFYVRNHLWVPQVDPSAYEIVIDLGDGEEKKYTLSDLQTKFPQHTITAVLQCSGNRRSHMSEGAGREASGLKWGVGAISNAEWRGPRLRDVLRDAGLNLEDPPEELCHAQFNGEDAYAASVPIEKVLDPRGDVLLVCEMNGETLPRDHGYPVRVLVPGNTGARSVKWVNRITLSEEESNSQWQQRDYKCFGPNHSRETVDWDSAPAIQETPVQSAVTALQAKDDSLQVEGYAFSGGGRRIIRVDISTDNGETWDQAELIPDKALGSKAWSWTRWKYQCKRQQTGSHVVVKAVDEAYNTQPDTHGPTFNFRGNLTSAWHRVKISEGKDDTQKDGKLH